jgi:hypothetical protein
VPVPLRLTLSVGQSRRRDAHDTQIDESSSSGAERNATHPQRRCGRQNTRPGVRESRCLSGAVLPPAPAPGRWPRRGRIAVRATSRFRGACPPPRPLHNPLLLFFRQPLPLLLAPAAAKCHALPQLVGKGLWRPFHVFAAAALAGPSERACDIVRGMYMCMCIHAIFRNKATPLIVN